MKRSLSVIVVGAGHLGRIHARLLASLAEVDVVGVVDPDPQALAAVAKEIDVPTYASCDQINADFSAAIVATPTITHLEVTTKLLQRGIHVLVEKPLAATVPAARQIVATAARHKCVLQVGHVERFNPAMEVARDCIQEPKFIETRRVCPHSFRSTDIGVVHDLMIHDIDLLLSLVAGPLVRVDALGASVFGDSEDIAQARIQFADGCIADLVASRVSLSVERTMNVFTPTGFVGVDMQTRRVDKVSPGSQLQDGFSLAGVAPAERAGLRDQLFNGLMDHETPTVPDQNALLAELEDFVGAIKQHRRPRVDGAAAVRALVVAAQVLEAIDAHQWDGRANGRVGPLGLAQHDIIRDPRLIKSDDFSRRRAG